MTRISRRCMLGRCWAAGGAVLGLTAVLRGQAAATGSPVKFTMDLRCGSIGVRDEQTNAIRLAHKYGFESVTPDPGFLAELSDDQRDKLLEELKEKRLVWGAAGLPVEFRRDEAAFRADVKQLPRLARGLQKAEVTRVGTWLRPNHDRLTYLANFRQHVQRLKECAKILADHGQRLGLEYVGPKTLWAASRYPFIHSMAETKDLIAEMGQGNVGFVLDSWHWYTARETGDDLRALSNQDVVACDLNDAPAGIPVNEQVDSRRELPAATGVIDLKTFLGVLVEINYDGPVRAEPFNRALNQLDDEAAVAATAAAMQKAFALVGRQA